MEIDKELYKQIKEYCDLNGLKTKDYIYNLLKNAFMADKYGDKPFKKESIEVTAPLFKVNEVTANGRVYPENVVKDAVENFRKNVIEGDKEFVEFVDAIGGNDKYGEIVHEALFGDEKKEETQIENTPLYTVEDVIKTNDKNVKKSTKRKIEAK